MRKTLIKQLVLTRDRHPQFHVGVPIFWKDKKGNKPQPMQPLPAGSINEGTWVPFEPNAISYYESKKPVTLLEDMKNMEQAVNARGELLYIWNPHCEIGTDQEALHPDFVEAYRRWELRQLALVYHREKGMFPFRDAYSFVEAVFPHPDVSETHPDMTMIKVFEKAHQIYVMGFAENFCVFAGCRSIVRLGGKPVAEKMTILTDCVAEIPGVPSAIPGKTLTEVFRDEMKQVGVTFMDSGIAITKIKDEGVAITVLAVDFNKGFTVEGMPLFVPGSPKAVEKSVKFIDSLIS